MSALGDLRVRIFADGAERERMLALRSHPLVAGFTTNPTLVRRAGIVDYRAFGREIAALIPDRPISFGVVADRFDEMEAQAREIASWGPNVYVKIPVTNARGEPAGPLLTRLVAAGVRVNVTALLLLRQVLDVSERLAGGPPCFVSVFAGRIADTGRDPAPVVAEAVERLCDHPNIEVIWASPREVLNVFQADRAGCHAIALTYDLIARLRTVGRDLDELSLETVRMFHDDAVALGWGLRGGSGAPMVSA